VIRVSVSARAYPPIAADDLIGTHGLRSATPRSIRPPEG
jgi:hypothetical protein